MKQIDDRTLEYLSQNPHSVVLLFAHEIESSDSTRSSADTVALDPYTGAPLEGSGFPERVFTSGQTLGLGRDRSSLCRLVANSSPSTSLLERFLSLEACDEAIEVEDVGVFYAYRAKTIQMVAEEASRLDAEQMTAPVADATESTKRYHAVLLGDLKAYLLDSSRKGLGILLVEV